ncbi:hypothetical protein DYB38_000149, partial [Aphanomyces astaci]
EGYLTKRSKDAALVTNWRKRYFRLVPGELLYFESKEDLEPRRRIQLGLDTVVSLNNDQGYTLCLSVKSSPTSEVFYVQATTEAEKKAWVDALFDAARFTKDVVRKGSSVVQGGVLLNIRVVQAKGLIAADTSGTSDPYVGVTLLDKNAFPIKHTTQKTNIIDKALDPVWNCDMRFGDKLDLNTVGAIRFEIIDHDNFTKDDNIGVVTVPLGCFKMNVASATSSETIDHWFHIDPPLTGARPTTNLIAFGQNERQMDERDHGELHLIMNLKGAGLPDFFRNLELRGSSPTKHQLTSSLDETDNRLEVTVVAAKDLVYVDPKDPTGQPTNAVNPMCEITLLDAKTHAAMKNELFRTVVQFKTISPVFPDANFVCGRVADIDRAGYVKATLYHVENAKLSVALGSVEVDLNTVANWYPLYSHASPPAKVGEVRLQLLLIGETRGEKEQREQIKRFVQLESAQFLMLQSMRDLDGARVSCAEDGYQIRHPKFYGVNGYLHAAHSQLVKANTRHQTPEDVFQSRGHIEGYSLLDVTVVGVHNMQLGDRVNRREINLNVGAVRHAIWGKTPVAGEVSPSRQRIGRNESRMERSQVMTDDRPYLRVRVVSGHNFIAGDLNGYSDPYCTLFLTNPQDMPYEQEKKRTAVVSKTLNPVWKHEDFTFGYNIDLNDAKSLLVHVKDHNNIGKSTPLGRVEIPLQDLCQGSATTTSINSVAVTKRYPITPEPWMKKLCLETEVMGNATVLAKLLMRQNQMLTSMTSTLSVTSEGSVGADAVLSMEEDESVYEDGQIIRTVSVAGSEPQWTTDRFQLQLSYKGLLADIGPPVVYRNEGFPYDIRVTVMCGRNLITCDRNSEADPFFTVTPVWGSGDVLLAAKRQSLTVYESRNPVWPTQEFVFGSNFDVTQMSHLSVHFYDRDWADLDTSVLKKLGNPNETHNSVVVPRSQLRKVTPWGDVDAAPITDVLEYDQKVLAFRKCGADGGNYFPARVRHYTPFPADMYFVLFEDSLDSISKIRKLMSYDVQGEIAYVRGDGTVDVKLVAGGRGEYLSRVPIRTLKPVKAFNDAVDTSVVHSASTTTARHDKWEQVQLQVLSLTEFPLPNPSVRPAVIVTLVAYSIDHAGVTTNSRGEILATAASNIPTDEQPKSPKFGGKWSKKGKTPTATTSTWTYVVPAGSNSPGSISLSSSVPPLVLDKPLLDRTVALVIRIVDQGSADVPSLDHPCLGLVKIDLAACDEGVGNWHLKIVPPETSQPYNKFYGAIHVRTTCAPRIVDDDVILPGLTPNTSTALVIKGVAEWYNDVLRKERQMAAFNWKALWVPETVVEYTYLARRQALRGALTARQNRQIDNLGTALNAIYRHVLGALREIALFDEFEGLSRDDMLKFNAVHTLSAHPDSEWLNRRINEMNVHVRKKIVVDLEMQLLMIAGVRSLPEMPLPDADLDSWLALRKARQDALAPFSDFLPMERGLLLKYSACFTGEGLVSWILRRPSVLWQDEWVQFAWNELSDDNSKLNWTDPELLLNAEAMQAPEGREHVVVWLKALFDAGLVESVSEKRDFADKSDRFYRMHNLEFERLHIRASDSTAPLDLVREVDCDTSEGELFCKKLTSHAAGFLGTLSSVSNLIGSAVDAVESLGRVKVPHLTVPNVSTSLRLPQETLWQWRYCIFRPDHKYLYLYESVHTTNATVVIDLSGTNTIVTYANPTAHGPDCFEIRQPVFLIPHPSTSKLMRMTDADVDASFLGKLPDLKAKVVLKAQDSQVWMQAMLMAGVKVTLEKRQKVLVSRLNAAVLHSKCIEHSLNFSSSDLEGSFQHLMNRVFGHDQVAPRSSDRRVKEVRAHLRAELKKAGAEGLAISAKYGRSNRFDPGPTDPRKYTPGTNCVKFGWLVRGGLTVENALGYEYAARIVAIRTPFTDATYPVKKQFLIDAAPLRLKDLLERYKITTRASWLEQPIAIRDLFLLYDVEYNNNMETVIEKDMLREDFRTMDGDLDPAKVRDKCLDLNYTFRPTDLEGCVSQFAECANGETPMGCFKIQLQSLSEQREIDWWYKLAPERGMLQRRELGMVRVRVEMKKHDKKTCVGSTPLPPPLAQQVERAIQMQNKASSVNDSNWFNRLKKTISSPLGSPAKVNKPPVLSIVQVDIVEGRKLIISDIRTSDPYVVVLLVNMQDEEKACGKTDIVPSTLNPKWKNQQFTLGRTDETHLHDKKALLLRLFDHDTYSANDPMGYLKLEFGKDERGYIRKVKLHHSGPGGSATSTVLDVSKNGEVEVFERLLRDTKAGQSTWAKAKGNSDEDGVLGRLRFKLKLTHQDYVDDKKVAVVGGAAANHTTASPSTQVVINTSNHLTRFAAEIMLASVDNDDLLDTMTWALVPRTVEGHVIMYDAKAEQMSHDSKKALREHVYQQAICGLTYDVTRVAAYDVVLHHIEKGRTFVGSWQLHPAMDSTTVAVACKCTEKGDASVIQVSLVVSFVGLNRADYIKRVLTETYQHASLEFDARSVAALGETAEQFLWDVCHVPVSPGQNLSDVLLAQLHKMHASTTLHWKHTPKLLLFVLHHALAANTKDRLLFRHTVPLDDILKRWSKLLSFVAEAKSQLTGRLHGELTPRLIGTLASLCDWTDLPDVETATRSLPQLHVGDIVQANVPTRATLQVGRLVDVRLGTSKYPDGATQLYPGRVVKTYPDEFVDVLVAANLHWSVSLAIPDHVLPQLHPGDVVYVGDVTLFHELRQATIVDYNASHDAPETPYLVAFTDEVPPVSNRPVEVWCRRDHLVQILPRVAVADVLPQLQLHEFVHVSSDHGKATKSAKITESHGNGTYSVQFIEGSLAVEANVGRDRLSPASTSTLVRGVVTHVHPNGDVYDVLQDQSWTMAAALPRDSLRLGHEGWNTDRYHLSSVYLVDVACGLPGSDVAAQLVRLWQDVNVIQTMLELPGAVGSVSSRDSLRGNLVQLVERDNAAPIIQGQYHGYTLGSKLEDVDKRKVMHLKNQPQDQISWANIVAVTVAPEPYVSIPGSLNLSGANSRAFRALLDQCKTQEVGVALTRQLVDAIQHVWLPWTREMPSVRVAAITSTINGKAVKDVSLTLLGSIDAAYVSTGKRIKGVAPHLLTIHVRFEILLPFVGQNNCAADAAMAALDHANAIVSTLAEVSSLVYVPTKLESWSLMCTDALDVPSDAVLYADISSLDLRGNPKPALALKALDDVRLNIVTTDGTTFEVTLAESTLRQECQLRHDLLPLCPAVVVSPVVTSTGRCDVQFVDDPDAVPHSIALADVRLDNLTVEVLSARDLYTTMLRDGKRQDEDISVRVYLMTDEVPPNGGGRNRLGYTVASDGTVVRDLKDIEYPRTTTTEILKSKLPDWEKSQKLKKFYFGHPTVDLTHMTMLALEVVSLTTGKTIGIHTTPLAKIQAREATRTEVLFVKGDPLNKEPQGNLTFRVCRDTCVQEGSNVLARLGSARDKWILSPMELLTQSMKFKTKHAERGLTDKLANVIVVNNAIEQEKEVQKLLRLVRLLTVQASLTPAGRSRGVRSLTAASAFPPPPPTSLNQVQAKHILAAGIATAETVLELVQSSRGLSSTRSLVRRKWSADYVDEDLADTYEVDVEQRSPFDVATDRLRSTLLKLHGVCSRKLLPKLDEMAAMALASYVHLDKAQSLLAFFEDEVEDLDHEDFETFDRLQKRTRVIQLTQLVSDLMRAFVKISILVDQDSKGHAGVRGDELVGIAIIPLIDLIDRKEHNQQYALHLDRMYRDQKTPANSGYDRILRRGTVHVKTKLTFSEVSLLETAIALLKEYKAQYIYQFEVSRRRVNSAVVPAQRRRWQTLLGYLEALRLQSTGKLHWETTPTLLEHVWDIFLSHKRQLPTFLVNFSSQVHMYREVVVKVHTRWVNLQPKLNELLEIQSQPQIHATRTPHLIAEIESEIEGLDVLRNTAWLQVQGKWLALEGALEELVQMKERNKLHMGRAPLLLNFVAQKCSKGLNDRHADAVSTVQFRWVALTKHDGPINELRLMDTHGLHWRRTNDLLMLLNEQCEGFSDVDEIALKAVTARWAQVETWLSDFLEMQLAHKIHCQEAPLALRKFNLIKDHAKLPSTSTKAHDEESVEGLMEWYAQEESRRELIRLPYHRITTDAERDNWLAYSENGRDSRLLITKQEMLFTCDNVRAALMDRGVLPKSMPVSQIDHIHKSTGLWPRAVLDEIDNLELLVEQNLPLPNPERVVELYHVLEDVGKGDLLWKVKHCVNQNHELAVPETFTELLYELKKRYLSTTEAEDLVKGLLNTMQKEQLTRLGINVPANASYAKVCSIMVANQVKEVPLPPKTSDIQDLLVGHNLDKKGDPVFCRGVRINTHALDSHVEALRKQLLVEAMRKRNSLVKTFPVASPALMKELADVVELDMSGDYMVLVHRFHDWLVHEAYTARLAGYAALDRCARALVQAKRDQVLTKEDMAVGLLTLQCRLPPEAFTRDELLEAARKNPGKIKPPSESLAKACPTAENAKAMAYYAALRTTAHAFQKHSSFASRFDAATQKAVDAMDIHLTFETIQQTSLPDDKSKLTLGYMMADWLLGCDDTPIKLKTLDGQYYMQRLQWASAAFAIRHRWWQFGVGWCDTSPAAQLGVGVKVLLDDLLLMSGENKMHMLKAEHLLKEINTKCYQLRPRENEALQNILWREAYSVVTKHWLPHSCQLDELVQMHKDGTFSISRTPELLEAMATHTEGLAGTTETIKPVDDSTNQPLDEWSEKQMAEWRKGQRKSLMNDIEPGVHLNVPDVAQLLSPDEENWKSLAVEPKAKPPRNVTWSFAEAANQGKDQVRDATKVLNPNNPLDTTILQLAAKHSTSRKRTVSEELCTMLKEPTKWLMCGAPPPATTQARIPAKKFFPIQVVQDEEL